MTGLPYFCRELTDALSDVGVPCQAIPLLGSKAVYALGCAKTVWWLHRARLLYVTGVLSAALRLFPFARMWRVPVLYHWAGSDVLYAKKRSHASSWRTDILKLDQMTHWAGAPWLREEIRDFGIEASCVPLVIRQLKPFLNTPPVPFPETFTVISYLSGYEPDFYGAAWIMALARALPDVRFLIVGAQAKQIRRPVSANVWVLGWVNDMRAVYDQSTVHVRMTQHDGYGGTVQEALARGRYAIWTYPMAGALQARTYAELMTHVCTLLDRHRRGDLPLNHEGREYVAAHFHPERTIHNIRLHLETILGLSPGHKADADAEGVRV